MNVIKVHGRLLDDQTRCVHWHGPADVIAIRFPCCDRYYPCFECHADLEDHEGERWDRSRFEEPAVLCGVCGSEMSVRSYLACDHSCPSCGAAFNPGCSLHHHHYFEPGEPGTGTP